MYPYIVRATGMIDPSKPKSNPSIINGILMFKLEAPIKRMIPISRCLDEIVILMVFEIRKAVTKMRAMTAPIQIL